MKNNVRDRARGKGHEIKGKLKETAGKMSGNRDLEAEGRGEKLGGKIQKKVGEVEKVFED